MRLRRAGKQGDTGPGQWLEGRGRSRCHNRRSSAITERSRTLVFTDLDGTSAAGPHLLFGETVPVAPIIELDGELLPLIFCTSRRRPKSKASVEPSVILTLFCWRMASLVSPAGYFPAIGPPPEGEHTPRCSPSVRRTGFVICAPIARRREWSCRGFHSTRCMRTRWREQTGLTVKELAWRSRRRDRRALHFSECYPAENSSL